MGHRLKQRELHVMKPPQSANVQTTRHGRGPLGRNSAMSGGPRLEIPRGVDSAELIFDGQPVRLTNLSKLFWPELNLTKRDLLQYYADVAPVLLPHLQHRAMVMKRYPNGAGGEFFFMKRAPSPRPPTPPNALGPPSRPPRPPLQSRPARRPWARPRAPSAPRRARTAGRTAARDAREPRATRATAPTRGARRGASRSRDRIPMRGNAGMGASVAAVSRGARRRRRLPRRRPQRTVSPGPRTRHSTRRSLRSADRSSWA